MAPVKFDDLAKVASSVVSDDYQTSGYSLKAKQKTALSGAVVTTQVDFAPGEKVAAPAKVTWKLPRVYTEHVSVDKLEMDKSGKFKFEASSSKLYNGLTVECKSDLATAEKVVVSSTYTGVKDLQLKFEVKAAKPKDFNGEVTYAAAGATGGLKFTNAILAGGLPDVGFRYEHGAAFCSLVAKEKLGCFDASAHYKVCPKLKVAGTYNYARKTKAGSLTLAGCYNCSNGFVKVKASQDKSVCVSGKYNLAKGFGVLAGLKYSGKGVTYGAQISIE